MHECASVADDYISTIVKSFKNENAFFNILVDVFAAQLTRGQASDHLARSTYRVLIMVVLYYMEVCYYYTSHNCSCQNFQACTLFSSECVMLHFLYSQGNQF